MEYMIYILMLFITINTLFKLSFWALWQAAVYGLVAAVFVIAACCYAILQSSTQMADYLQNTVALQDMAIVITLESVVCFAYCVAFLRGRYGRGKLWWVEALKWYPGLLLFPVLFYGLTEAIFALPGTDFQVTAYSLAVIVGLALPLLSRLVRYLVPEDGLRLEIHFLASLFVCILGLLTTVSGQTTYVAPAASPDGQALVLSLALFLSAFFIGFVWNKLKWRFLQRKESKKTNK